MISLNRGEATGTNTRAFYGTPEDFTIRRLMQARQKCRRSRLCQLCMLEGEKDEKETNVQRSESECFSQKPRARTLCPCLIQTRQWFGSSRKYYGRVSPRTTMAVDGGSATGIQSNET